MVLSVKYGYITKMCHNGEIIPDMKMFLMCVHDKNVRNLKRFAILPGESKDMKKNPNSSHNGTYI